MTAPACQAAAALPPEALHAAFNAAFSDYVMPGLSVPLARWPQFLARQGVDLAHSRASLDAAGRVAAFVLVAPRPALGRWRIATTGTRPDARGQGAARTLMQDALQRARAAGLRGVELEVIAQNTAARTLYEQLGFTAHDELYGYLGVPPAPTGLPPVRAVGVDEARAWLAAAEQRLDPVPMQQGVLCLACDPATLRLWHSADDAAQLIAAVDGTLRVRTLTDPTPGQHHTAALLAAMRTQAPVAVPRLQRAALGGDALRALGWQRQALHQLWMRHALEAMP